MSNTIYRKYRPIDFDEIQDQSHITEILKAEIQKKSYTHAYLFTGQRGCGKTSTARILARAINCLDPKDGNPCNKCENCISSLEQKAVDIIEIDAASNRSIDDIREFKEKIAFSPSIYPKKVVIIDEVHMLTKEAFNALLKTLEEPPAHVVLILATTEVNKLPETIISRCQWFQFSLGNDGLKYKINQIATNEGKSLDSEVVDLLIAKSGGSFRDAESLLERLINSTESKIDIDYARKSLGLIENQIVEDFVKLLISKEYQELKKLLNDIKLNNINAYNFVEDSITYIMNHDLFVEENFKLVKKLIKLLTIIRLSSRKLEQIEIFVYEYCSGNKNAKNKIINKLINKDGIINKPESTEIKEKKPDEVKKSTAGEGDFEKIIDKWVDISAELSRNNQVLAAYFSYARPYSFAGQKLTIVVKYKIHKKLLDKAESKAIVLSLVRTLLADMNVEVIEYIHNDEYFKTSIGKIANQSEVFKDL